MLSQRLLLSPVFVPQASKDELRRLHGKDKVRFFDGAYTPFTNGAFIQHGDPRLVARLVAANRMVAKILAMEFYGPHFAASTASVEDDAPFIRMLVAFARHAGCPENIVTALHNAASMSPPPTHDAILQAIPEEAMPWYWETVNACARTVAARPIDPTTGEITRWLTAYSRWSRSICGEPTRAQYEQLNTTFVRQERMFDVDAAKLHRTALRTFLCAITSFHKWYLNHAVMELDVYNVCDGRAFQAPYGLTHDSLLYTVNREAPVKAAMVLSDDGLEPGEPSDLFTSGCSCMKCLPGWKGGGYTPKTRCTRFVRSAVPRNRYRTTVLHVWHSAAALCRGVTKWLEVREMRATSAIVDSLALQNVPLVSSNHDGGAFLVPSHMSVAEVGDAVMAAVTNYTSTTPCVTFSVDVIPKQPVVSATASGGETMSSPISGMSDDDEQTVSEDEDALFNSDLCNPTTKRRRLSTGSNFELRGGDLQDAFFDLVFEFMKNHRWVRFRGGKVYQFRAGVYYDVVQHAGENVPRRFHDTWEFLQYAVYNADSEFFRFYISREHPERRNIRKPGSIAESCGIVAYFQTTHRADNPVLSTGCMSQRVSIYQDGVFNHDQFVRAAMRSVQADGHGFSVADLEHHKACFWTPVIDWDADMPNDPYTGRNVITTNDECKSLHFETIYADFISTVNCPAQWLNWRMLFRMLLGPAPTDTPFEGESAAREWTPARVWGAVCYLGQMVSASALSTMEFVERCAIIIHGVANSGKSTILHHLTNIPGLPKGEPMQAGASGRFGGRAWAAMVGPVGAVVPCIYLSDLECEQSTLYGNVGFKEFHQSNKKPIGPFEQKGVDLSESRMTMNGSLPHLRATADEQRDDAGRPIQLAAREQHGNMTASVVVGNTASLFVSQADPANARRTIVVNAMVPFFANNPNTTDVNGAFTLEESAVIGLLSLSAAAVCFYHKTCWEAPSDERDPSKQPRVMPFIDVPCMKEIIAEQRSFMVRAQEAGQTASKNYRKSSEFVQECFEVSATSGLTFKKLAELYDHWARARNVPVACQYSRGQLKTEVLRVYEPDVVFQEKAFIFCKVLDGWGNLHRKTSQKCRAGCEQQRRSSCFIGLSYVGDV